MRKRFAIFVLSVCNDLTGGRHMPELVLDWKKYQEAEFKAVSILINKQGTIYQNFLAGKECELVKQRAQDLKSFYDDLIEE